MGQVEKAISLAQEYHAGVEYVPGVSYFDGHLQPIAEYAIQLGYDDDATVAGCYLHDIVEDTLMTFDGLRRRGFTESVVVPVDAVTKREGEVREQYLGRIILVPRAVVIKFCDSTKNLQGALNAGPTHPKFQKWMSKYPDNLRVLQPYLPSPTDLRDV